MVYLKFPVTIAGPKDQTLAYGLGGIITLVYSGSPKHMLLTGDPGKRRVSHELIRSRPECPVTGEVDATVFGGQLAYRSADDLVWVCYDHTLGETDAVPAVAIWNECGCAQAWFGKPGSWLYDLLVTARGEVPRVLTTEERAELTRGNPVEVLLVGYGDPSTELVGDGVLSVRQVFDAMSALDDPGTKKIVLVRDLVAAEPGGEPTAANSCGLISLLTGAKIPCLVWPITGPAGWELVDLILTAAGVATETTKE